MGANLRKTNLKGIRNPSRREFLKLIGLGSCGLVAFGWLVKSGNTQKRLSYSLVIVDFNKCTGCRTCEAVCSQVNNKVSVNGKELPGLGNPYLSNIRVYAFNPPMDVPNLCVMCQDAPCIEACPVPPDPLTGRKALYRDEKTLAIKADIDQCIGCGACAQACQEKRVGAIIPNPLTKKPERMCTLCDGDPACVKHCPFGALTYVKGGLDGRHYALSPEKVAQKLISLWYFHQE